MYILYVCLWAIVDDGICMLDLGMVLSISSFLITLFSCSSTAWLFWLERFRCGCLALFSCVCFSNFFLLLALSPSVFHRFCVLFQINITFISIFCSFASHFEAASVFLLDSISFWLDIYLRAPYTESSSSSVPHNVRLNCDKPAATFLLRLIYARLCQGTYAQHGEERQKIDLYFVKMYFSIVHSVPFGSTMLRKYQIVLEQIYWLA